MANPPVTTIPTSTADIRTAFLTFFETQGHQVVASDTLIPGNDPTLLFTNAGMNQFKDVFLGQELRDYQRATSSQRCVRAGGKHNDLENVGYTARHHTFFEMLGNFSFGDYFKREAIQFAWNFLTKVLQLPPEKLWVTVHISDDEAERIWKDEMGIDPTRFSKLDEDNFWQMGDTGPCGPSSEIFYDHGEGIFGDPPGGEHDDGDRYIEIWNLVFMQFEKQANGEMIPLPNPSIDTGMGLERIAAVMQNVHNNYEIDLFQSLLKSAASILKVNDLSAQSLRVVADHIRSVAFLIADGVLPSNEGRGYVLRRIMRRAIRHGHKLGATEHFFYKLAEPLADVMGDAYPELREKLSIISDAIYQEEAQFAKTLDKGMQVLNDALTQMDGNKIEGEVVFKLYDTYGFPVDLTNDIAREKGLDLDMSGYEAAMAEQKSRSKDAGGFDLDYTAQIKVEGETRFTGYDQLQGEHKIVALFDENGEVEVLGKGQNGFLVLDQTPFYAESGGQVGDKGFLYGKGFKAIVKDVQKQGAHHIHHVDVIEGEVNKVPVESQVDEKQRESIKLNHSATHLLHAVLRELLGSHVEQKGSLNDADKLRFDFSHTKAVTPDELSRIEQKVNQLIRANSLVETDITDKEGAMKKGALALFGEKYGDSVRVLTMGEGYSVELCGGTHVTRTGDIGLFKIVQESGVASGVRRIEAVTGEAALDFVSGRFDLLNKTEVQVKATDKNIVDKIEKLLSGQRSLEKHVQQLQAKLAASSGSDITTEVIKVGDINVLSKELPGVDRKALLSTLDQLKNKCEPAVILLASKDDKGITLVAGVSKSLTKSIKAGDLMKEMSAKIGGKGGGRPDTAQGGGQDVSKLDEMLASVPEWVANQTGY
ncbi:MAG: alanine--tRNA ligase [Cellvibrionales bacterium]|nr:alanine--tRNA ligase [Cellvibrionales bacterium]